MSFVCSLIAIEWVINGDIVTAILAFVFGIIIGSLLIDAVETLVAIEGGEK